MIWFSDLVDLWVIKIKKRMILCARSTSRSREQSKKRRSCSKNMGKVYFTVKLTRLLDYQTCRHFFVEKFTRSAMVCGLFFFSCGMWAFRALIDWSSKLHSRG